MTTPYKIEDIQTSRQSEFEKEVERKRIDMENYLTPQKPKDLNFSYGDLDGKITEMDSLISDKMNQRNIEMEQFQNHSYNVNMDPEKWLSSKETSVKNNKLSLEQSPIIKNTQLKHIPFDEKNQNQGKKVSWGDTVQEPMINIFNKLKKQHIDENPINENHINETFINEKHIDERNNAGMNIYSNEKQYIEQTSMPLPEIQQEEISRNQITLTSNNELLPKIEIIKQLNEMNKKIDNLFDMIFKLTTFIQNTNNEIITNADEIITNTDVST